MTEPTTDPNETPGSLLARLDEFARTLTAEQRTLLWAILTVAKDVTEVFFPEPTGDTEATGPEDVTNFSDEFAAAYTPGKAELIMAYAHALRPGQVHHHETAGLVGRGTGWSSPAMVGRQLVGKSTTGQTGTGHHHPHGGSTG